MAEYMFGWESDEESSFGPELQIRKTVQPYNYEPLAKRRCVEQVREEESDETKENVEPTDDDDEGHTDISWCNCTHCVPMRTKNERKCCRHYAPVKAMMDRVGVSCITKHPGFQPNCQNIWVLQRSFLDFLDDYGPVGDEEPIHKLYRYVAYRIFTRWIWGKLGRGNRRPVPACAVSAIRGSFPEEDQVYKGFYLRGPLLSD